MYEDKEECCQFTAVAIIIIITTIKTNAYDAI